MSRRAETASLGRNCHLPPKPPANVYLRRKCRRRTSPTAWDAKISLAFYLSCSSHPLPDQEAKLSPQKLTATSGPTVSERVRHDSVSTVAFKFQAHHLFHIFKFDVQEFGLRTAWQVFRSFMKFSCTFLRSNVLVLVGRQLLLLESFLPPLPSVQLRFYLL